MRQVEGVYVCVLPQCGKELAEITVKNFDPFCSNKCCLEYHDVQIQMNDSKRGVPVASSS